MNDTIKTIEKTLNIAEDRVSSYKANSSSISLNKLNFILDTLNKLKHDYSNDYRFAEKTIENFGVIVRWSIDEWDWDDSITKGIWKINEAIK